MWVIAESITAGLIISLINKYLIGKDIFECCRTVNINENNNDNDISSVSTSISDSSSIHHVHV